MKKLINIDPDRHFQASKLFPTMPFDPSERWKTLYGIKAHKYIAEKEGWAEGTNKIWSCDQLGITIGYKVDGIKDNVVYEVKEYKHYLKYYAASVIQVNLYKIMEECESCRLVTYRINVHHISQPPRYTIRDDTPQLLKHNIISDLEAYVAPQLKRLQKLECYR